MIVYRGSLKSCNYHCSYCPFSKHAMTDVALAKDREQWFIFVENYLKQAGQSGIRAMMLAPYGEALIHTWYWEGLAQICAHPKTEAAGAQTNLGFDVSRQLLLFKQQGGRPEKLRIWATFHPEMTTVFQFVRSCRQLTQAGVQMCAGAVGVPEQIPVLTRLRKELPDGIYLWINRMDGLRRSYTAEEIRAFSSIDPYFYRELQLHPAQPQECQTRYFAKTGGRTGMCNISTMQQTDWKELSATKAAETFRTCGQRQCTCYLAYGGRNNLENQMLFGPWPLFRIPRRPKAVFLDIAGTLLSHTQIPEQLQTALAVLVKREKSLLFFATTLPCQDAKKRCRTIWHLFSGGIFAGGAHVLVEEAKECYVHKETRIREAKEWFYVLDEPLVQRLVPLQQQFRCRMLTSRNNGRCYKITLFRARRKHWQKQEAEAVMEYLPQADRKQVRCLIEGNCLQILPAPANKASGVRMICTWLKIPLQEIFAAGDSKEDVAMMELTEK